MLECDILCLIMSLSDLVKSVGRQLTQGHPFIQPAMLCINKEAQSNTSSIKWPLMTQGKKAFFLDTLPEPSF